MRSLLERSRYVVAVASLSLLALALVGFGWGVARGIAVTVDLFRDSGWKGNIAVVDLLETIDLFLLATVLMLIGLGLWELFVGDLDLPEWLVMRDLTDLKVKLSDVIVLVLGIKFVEKLVVADKPIDVMYDAIGIALVGGMLIAFAALRPRSH